MPTDSDIREVIYRALKHFDPLHVSEINVIVVSPQEWIQLGHPWEASAVTLVGSNPPTIILRDDYPHPRGPVAVILHEISHVVDLSLLGWTSDQFDAARENIVVPFIMEQ